MLISMNVLYFSSSVTTESEIGSIDELEFLPELIEDDGEVSDNMDTDDDFRYQSGKETSTEDDPEDEGAECKETVRDVMCRIKHEHNVSMRAVAAIAGLFRAHGHEVPKDARTILGTPRQPLDDKTFIHFVFNKGLSTF